MCVYIGTLCGLVVRCRDFDFSPSFSRFAPQGITKFQPGVPPQLI